jgi:hypothetical protein
MLNRNDVRAPAQRLAAKLRNRLTGTDDLSISLARVRVRSKLSQWTAGLKEHQRQTGKRLTKVCRIGLMICRDAGQTVRAVRSSVSEAFRPTGLRAARWVRHKLVRLPFYPVEVAKRPVPTEEDPRISRKVEEARLWMKTHGIDDQLRAESGRLRSREISPTAALPPQESDEPLIPRRPPRAAGRPSRLPAKSAGEG